MSSPREPSLLLTTAVTLVPCCIALAVLAPAGTASVLRVPEVFPTG